MINARSMVAAAVPVLVIGALVTTIDIESRVAAALPTAGALAQAFHRGQGPCLRWLDGTSIAPAETEAVAAAMRRADLAQRAPEALALAWGWTREEEGRKHTATPGEEYRALVLGKLSMIDRFWLRTLGRHRLAELGPEEIDATPLAEKAAARMPPAAQKGLREIYDAHPGPLVRPADARLIEALKR